jgi:hypothetical protein
MNTGKSSLTISAKPVGAGAELAKDGVSGGGDGGVRDFVDGSIGGYGGDVSRDVERAAAVAK